MHKTLRFAALICCLTTCFFRTSLADKNKTLRPSPKIIFISGLVGAGKTTFASMLKENISNAEVLFEPAEKWLDVQGLGSLWDLFLNDGKRWAMTTEIYISLSRTKDIETQASKSLHDLIFVDRSIYEDRYVFARLARENGNLSDLEWVIYKEWFSWHSQHSAKPSGFIYLRASPETALARLQKRARFEENDFPLTLQQKFYKYYEELFFDKKSMPSEIANIPVLVINADVNFKDDENTKKKYIAEVLAFTNKVKVLTPLDHVVA